MGNLRSDACKGTHCVSCKVFRNALQRPRPPARMAIPIVPETLTRRGTNTRTYTHATDRLQEFVTPKRYDSKHQEGNSVNTKNVILHDMNVDRDMAFTTRFLPA